MATKILYVLTAPQMCGFIQGQIAFLRASGMHITLCVPEETSSVLSLSIKEGADVVVCPMQRDIRPMGDLSSYLKLTKIIWRIRPDITVTIGPKAGLIGGLAAASCQVKCRIQTKWGIRLETTKGILRQLLVLADKIAAACADLVLCDSHSGKERTIELSLAPRNKVRVVGNGSANGIDTEKFSPSTSNLAAGMALRERLGVEHGDPLVGFVGRVSRDKGLAELRAVWPIILSKHPKAKLAIIGSSELLAEDHLLYSELLSLPGVKALGQIENLERVFPAFDILLLPSHREGFGVVVLEAAALEVPTVGFEVTGMKDSVLSGITGKLVKFGDIQALGEAAISYLNDPDLRKSHGRLARERASTGFKQEDIWQQYLEIYKEVTVAAGLCTSIKQ